jgi:intracellular sulfur oxidation DsrE/DsrF family protein
VERLKTGRTILDSARSVPHVGTDLSRLHDPLVRVSGLVESKDTVDVGVVQPEDGVISCLRDNRHVATGQNVNVVMESFQAGGVEVAIVLGESLRAESIVDLVGRESSPEQPNPRKGS